MDEKIHEDLTQYAEPMTQALHQFFPDWHVHVYYDPQVDIVYANVPFLTFKGKFYSGYIWLNSLDRAKPIDQIQTMCVMKALKLFQDVTTQLVRTHHGTVKDCISLTKQNAEAYERGKTQE